ncbi:hypothetical protein BJY04DRAFT_222674 [Aspergillus karnatakaensis]|uniref:uncharacterized protein n=1 Tax=Aspergillus karnatakaensis TaxID=1810916 RepID=UPI003CCD3AC0
MKCCTVGCAPPDAQCCRGGKYCPGGKRCVIRPDGTTGCCPPAGCYELSQIVYWYWYVYWYIEVYYVRIEVTTSTLSLTSSRESSSTRVTVTASNSAAASSLLEDLSSSLSEAAATTPDLADIPTLTRTSTVSTRSTTSTTRSFPTSSFDNDDDEWEPPFDSTFSFPTFSPPTTEVFPTDTGPETQGGGDGSASTLSTHGAWLYFGTAVLSFLLMVLL